MGPPFAAVLVHVLTLGFGPGCGEGVDEAVGSSRHRRRFLMRRRLRDARRFDEPREYAVANYCQDCLRVRIFLRVGHKSQRETQLGDPA